jgi:hypothetical protein
MQSFKSDVTWRVKFQRYTPDTKLWQQNDDDDVTADYDVS